MTDHTVDVWKEIVSSLANKLNGELEHVDDLYVAIEELDSHVKSSADFIAEQDKTIASLLAQLEQREQEVADLTAKAQDAVNEADNQHKKYCQLAREYDEEKNSQNNLFRVLNARIVELADQLKQAKQPVQWHPASEQPERWPVLVDFLAVKEYGHIYATYYGFIPQSTVRWCYIDEVK